MFLVVAQCDKDVIHVDEREGETSQDVIHQPLKCLSSVGETKWHPQKFKKAEGGDDRCLVNVVRCHWNLMITLAKVDLGEDGAPVQVGIEILDMRDGVAVVGCSSIE